MPIYDYRCSCGLRFEKLVRHADAQTPDCPACGGTPVKTPSAVALSGLAQQGLGRDRMPQTWRGTYEGNPEYVAGLRRTWEKRQKLEARYPELAGDTRPVHAHEGKYHSSPLRAGDLPAAGHGHEHAHGHGHSAQPSPPPASE